MPNVFLDPIAEIDPAGNPTGQVTDPAADIVAFLLSVPTDWQPESQLPAARAHGRREAGAQRSDDRLAQRVVPAQACRAVREGRHPERLAGDRESR